MIVVDDTGHIAIVNSEAERLFGYARDDLQGQAIEMLIPERARTSHIDERSRYLRQPSLRRMGGRKVLYGRRSDGSEFPVEISLSPVTTEEGQYVSSAIRDISERIELEREITAARHAAERANKANRAFLAAASHDLRQPVQALSLLSGALRRTVTEPKALEMLEVQDQSLTGMTNLLNSLLDISRLDAGVISPRLEAFPVGMIFERLRAEFTRQATQKGLRFVAAEADVIVESDPNLLAEIIQNLVSNAVRYTDNGDVTLRCRVDKTHCHIEVKDTGVGIEADQIEEIFEEFHQCNPNSSHKEGFGLGLAIVRRLSDLLGHTISVESAPGKGSCFIVQVPIATRVASTNGPVGETASESQTAHILLIEDDSQVARALRMLLEAAGHTVSVAASKQEAMIVAAELAELPRLVITDYHLAGPETGVDTILALRETYKSIIPAFVVSGDTSKLVEEARAIPGCTLMSKPVDVENLLHKVNAVLANTTEH